MPTSPSAGTASVLVVEDDAELCDAILTTLACDGYQVAAACDGQAALDYLRCNPLPSLILLDWNMAPMNGAQFMAMVAKDVSLSAVPVIVLTADMRAADKLKGCGFSGVLIKPFDLQTLFEMVSRHCARLAPSSNHDNVSF